MYKYIHPGTIKQGYLTKSPPLEKTRLKQWKKRWCIFSRANGEDPCIMYYRTEETAFSSLPIKRIELKHCFKVEMDLVHSSHKNIFAIHLPDRVYYFSAASQIEMSEWSDALCTHLKLASEDSAPGNSYGETGARANTLPSELYYNTRSRGAPLASEAFYSTRPVLTMPVESFYNSTQHPTVGTPPVESFYSSRPLPKAPNSPLPPIPVDANSRLPNPPSSPSRTPRTPPPLPPAAHSQPPPPPPHSPSAFHATPPHIRVPSPHGPAPPVPSHSSSQQRAHIAPPPPLPHRPHSPSSSSDMNNRQPNSALQSLDGDIDFRPPAPPPKAPTPLENSPTGSLESLEEAPPTPPPRPHDNPSPLPTVSSQTFSSSDSEDDDDGGGEPPVCPPRPAVSPLPRPVPRIPRPALSPPSRPALSSHSSPDTECNNGSAPPPVPPRLPSNS